MCPPSHEALRVTASDDRAHVEDETQEFHELAHEAPFFSLTTFSCLFSATASRTNISMTWAWETCHSSEISRSILRTSESNRKFRDSFGTSARLQRQRVRLSTLAPSAQVEHLNADQPPVLVQI